MRVSRWPILSVVTLFALVCSVIPCNAQPDFSAEMALRRLYGNYDPTTKTATWKDFALPKNGDEDERNRFICEIDPEPLRVHLLLDAPTVEKGIQKHYFVTWATPASWTQGSGRICHVAIGATVFALRGKRWEIESSNRYMASAGTYGYPPEAPEFVKVGTNKHGVFLETGDMTQGRNFAGVKLIAPVGADFREVWRASTYDDNEGACSNDPKAREKDTHLQECYERSAGYKLVPKAGADFFDIRLESTGTLIYEPPKIVPENWVKVFRFERNRYEEIRKVVTHPAKKAAPSKPVASQPSQ